MSMWDFHDVCMIFLEDFDGISEGMLWEFYGILMGFFVVPMLFPCYIYDLSMGFLLDSYGIAMIFL